MKWTFASLLVWYDVRNGISFGVKHFKSLFPKKFNFCSNDSKLWISAQNSKTDWPWNQTKRRRRAQNKRSKHSASHHSRWSWMVYNCQTTNALQQNVPEFSPSVHKREKIFTSIAVKDFFRNIYFWSQFSIKRSMLSTQTSNESISSQLDIPFNLNVIYLTKTFLITINRKTAKNYAKHHNYVKKTICLIIFDDSKGGNTS